MKLKPILQLKQIIYILLVSCVFQSCYINSNLMLRTDRNFVFDTIPTVAPAEYKISTNDLINFRLFANDGFRIIDISSGMEANQVNLMRNVVNYRIEADGKVRLPVINDVHLAGLTVKEAEFLLEEKYGEYYVNPYVQINVVNKRIIVFPGNGSDARVITLENNNTTLMEALALAGGITERGRAAKIKLMRKSANGKRQVYLIDLSTIDGLKYADMIVQANDYIYVQPVPQISREILQELAPIVSLISSAVIIYTVLNRF